MTGTQGSRSGVRAGCLYSATQILDKRREELGLVVGTPWSDQLFVCYKPSQLPSNGGRGLSVIKMMIEIAVEPILPTRKLFEIRNMSEIVLEIVVRMLAHSI